MVSDEEEDGDDMTGVVDEDPEAPPSREEEDVGEGTGATPRPGELIPGGWTRLERPKI